MPRFWGVIWGEDLFRIFTLTSVTIIVDNYRTNWSTYSVNRSQIPLLCNGLPITSYPGKTTCPLPLPPFPGPLKDLWVPCHVNRTYYLLFLLSRFPYGFPFSLLGLLWVGQMSQWLLQGKGNVENLIRDGKETISQSCTRVPSHGSCIVKTTLLSFL